MEVVGRDAGEVECGGRRGGEEPERERERECRRGPAEHRRRPHGREAGGLGGSEAAPSLPVASGYRRKTRLSLSLGPTSSQLN